MKVMRIRLAAIGGALGMALVAAPVGAGTVVDVTVTHGIVLDTQAAATRTCGFLIELHTVGKEVLVSRTDAEGRLVATTLVQVYNGYLLNPANGKTISSRVAGPVRDAYAADGTITETSGGATVRTAPGAGIVSGFIGHSRVVMVPTGAVDEDGNPEYDFTEDTFNGLFLGNGGVCDVLR